jgi:hypothetical protein
MRNSTQVSTAGPSHGSYTTTGLYYKILAKLPSTKLDRILQCRSDPLKRIRHVLAIINAPRLWGKNQLTI